MGLTIAQLRGRAGMTQQELADQLGCSVNVIGDWESGRKGERIERTVRLCGALGCEASELMSQGVRSLRSDRGLTQRQLASVIGVNTRTVERWESGEAEMEGLGWAVGLCRILDCSTTDLIS